MELLDGNSFFQTIGWGKYGLLKTPLEVLGQMWNAEMSVLKWRNGELRCL